MKIVKIDRYLRVHYIHKTHTCISIHSFSFHRLRSMSTVQLRFVTNTTKESKGTLLQRLHRIGFASTINEDDMFTSLSAAVQYVQTHNLKPFYLLSEDAKRDFDVEKATTKTTANDGNDENAVVVGLAPDKFVYEAINTAFRYV